MGLLKKGGGLAKNNPSIAATYEGQAHFAQPGCGKICGTCRYWGNTPAPDQKNSKGTAAKQPCLKAKDIMWRGTNLPEIPSDAIACRHYEQRPKLAN